VGRGWLRATVSLDGVPGAESQVAGTADELSNGFLNPVSQVRFLPGGHCDVSGHRAHLSRDIAPRPGPLALVIQARVQGQLPKEFPILV
jgi:hypothetical protein